jgi:hypothetical protein
MGDHLFWLLAGLAGDSYRLGVGGVQHCGRCNLRGQCRPNSKEVPMSNLLIRSLSLAVIAALSLADPPAATARAEACTGQSICEVGCPGNLTLFCQIKFGCAPGNPPYAVCEPGGCGWWEPEPDLVLCGGYS